MSAPEFRFGSPEERKATMYLKHVAGFEISSAEERKFISPSDLEEDAILDPIAQREILNLSSDDISLLSQEDLLRRLVFPNISLGLFGDESGDPVILEASAGVTTYEEPPDDYTMPKNRRYAWAILTPSLGKLSEVSYIADTRSTENGINQMRSLPNGVVLQMHENQFYVSIAYRSPPKTLPPESI